MRLFWNKYRRNPLLDIEEEKLFKPEEIDGAKEGNSWGEYEVPLTASLVPLGHYGRKGEGAPVTEGLKVFVPSNGKRIVDHLPTVVASVSEPKLLLVDTTAADIIDVMAEGMGNIEFPEEDCFELEFKHLYSHDDCQLRCFVANADKAEGHDLRLGRFISSFPRIRSKTRSWRNALGILFLNGRWCRVRDGLIKKVYAEGYDPLQRAADGQIRENGITVFKKTIDLGGDKRILFYRPDRSKVYVCDSKGAFQAALDASRIEFVSDRKMAERVEAEVTG